MGIGFEKPALQELWLAEVYNADCELENEEIPGLLRPRNMEH